MFFFYASGTPRYQQQLLRMHSHQPGLPARACGGITFARYITTSLFDVFKGYPLGRPTTAATSRRERDVITSPGKRDALHTRMQHLCVVLMHSTVDDLMGFSKNGF